MASIQDIITKVQTARDSLYPFGPDFPYNTTPFPVSAKPAQYYNEIISDLQKLNLDSKSKPQPISKTSVEPTAPTPPPKKQKVKRPNTGGLSKPLLLSDKMTKILQENLQKGNPEFQYREKKIVYTHALLVSWWSKYIQQEGLRESKTVKIEKLLYNIYQPYQKEIHYENRETTFAQLQKLLVKLIDKRLEGDYNDWKEYFDQEKNRLNSSYPKNERNSVSSAKSQPTKKDTTPQKIESKIETETKTSKRGRPKKPLPSEPTMDSINHQPKHKPKKNPIQQEKELLDLINNENNEDLQSF